MLRAALCAIGFLTRLPVPARVVERLLARAPAGSAEADFARSAACFSWVGALLGVILQLLAFTCVPLFGAHITGVLLVAALAWLSGGLHLDGLADTADGLSASRGSPERALEVMRDSRIGAHGALALVLVLLLKSELFAALAEARWLWLAPTLARFACTLLLARFPYARSEGLGKSFAGRVGRSELSWGALPFIALLGFMPRLGVWLALLVGLALAYAFAARVTRFLGGLTGDVLGAAVELTELSVLLGLVAISDG